MPKISHRLCSFLMNPQITTKVLAQALPLYGAFTFLLNPFLFLFPSWVPPFLPLSLAHIAVFLRLWGISWALTHSLSQAVQAYLSLYCTVVGKRKHFWVLCFLLAWQRTRDCHRGLGK